MIKGFVRFLTFIGVFILVGCAGLGDDNTLPPAPLSTYSFQFKPFLVWSVATSGTGKDYLRLDPIIKEGKIYVAGKSGVITALKLSSRARKLWRKNIGQVLTSGPAVGEGVVIIVGKRPQVFALSAETGDILWYAMLPNQVLAPPAVGQGEVVLKTVDGQVLALELQTGQNLWTYKHGAPMLVLRPGSAPLIIGNEVILGFSDGILSALNLTNGRLLWERNIAFSRGVTVADQLIDIAADPLLSHEIIYVVTYQGKLAAVSLQSGKIIWQHSFSSYSGFAVNGDRLFVSDSAGGLWAFNRLTGELIWQQQLLRYRGLTAPVIFGNDLVVGDREGYLHWCSQVDGRLLARTLVHINASIIANPAVECRFVCALTREDGLSAWTTYSARPV